MCDGRQLRVRWLRIGSGVRRRRFRRVSGCGLGHVRIVRVLIHRCDGVEAGICRGVRNFIVRSLGIRRRELRMSVNEAPGCFIDLPQRFVNGLSDAVGVLMPSCALPFDITKSTRSLCKRSARSSIGRPSGAPRERFLGRSGSNGTANAAVNYSRNPVNFSALKRARRSASEVPACLDRRAMFSCCICATTESNGYMSTDA